MTIVARATRCASPPHGLVPVVFDVLAWIVAVRLVRDALID